MQQAASEKFENIPLEKMGIQVGGVFWDPTSQRKKLPLAEHVRH
jgi:hypothetical protein